jgi:hypothetical protein
MKLEIIPKQIHKGYRYFYVYPIIYRIPIDEPLQSRRHEMYIHADTRERGRWTTSSTSDFIGCKEITKEEAEKLIKRGRMIDENR